MGKTREIRLRMKAVGNIRRITKTMQMIAASKFAKAQSRATASKPYADALFGLVAQLADAAGDVEHPLLGTGNTPGADNAPEVTLVISSNRGLCGPYNGNVTRMALNHFRESEAARTGRVDAVGRKGSNVLKFNQIDATVREFGDEPRYEEIEHLAQGYIDAFSAGEISAVRVISMQYISAGKQRPRVLQLLPFDNEGLATAETADTGESDADRNALYEFIPSPEALLDTLLPAAVKSTLFQCFNEAVVSEHVARMVAMKAATDNAGKLRKGLQRKFNRARQSQITTEINEIVGGAAALE